MEVGARRPQGQMVVGAQRQGGRGARAAAKPMLQPDRGSATQVRSGSTTWQHAWLGCGAGALPKATGPALEAEALWGVEKQAEEDPSENKSERKTS